MTKQTAEILLGAMVGECYRIDGNEREEKVISFTVNELGKVFIRTEIETRVHKLSTLQDSLKLYETTKIFERPAETARPARIQIRQQVENGIDEDDILKRIEAKLDLLLGNVPRKQIDVSENTPQLLDENVENESYEERRNKSEKQLLIDMLQKHNYSKTKTAIAMGVDRKTLYNKMAKFGLNPKREALEVGAIISEPNYS